MPAAKRSYFAQLTLFPSGRLIEWRLPALTLMKGDDVI